MQFRIVHQPDDVLPRVPVPLDVWPRHEGPASWFVHREDPSANGARGQPGHWYIHNGKEKKRLWIPLFILVTVVDPSTLQVRNIASEQYGDLLSTDVGEASQRGSLRGSSRGPSLDPSSCSFSKQNDGSIWRYLHLILKIFCGRALNWFVRKLQRQKRVFVRPQWNGWFGLQQWSSSISNWLIYMS